MGPSPNLLTPMLLGQVVHYRASLLTKPPAGKGGRAKGVLVNEENAQNTKLWVFNTSRTTALPLTLGVRVYLLSPGVRAVAMSLIQVL